MLFNLLACNKSKFLKLANQCPNEGIFTEKFEPYISNELNCRKVMHDTKEEFDRFILRYIDRDEYQTS